jgi:hypothetical protein
MSGTMWDATDALGATVDWSAGVVPGTTSNADPGAAGVAGSAGLFVGTGTGQMGMVPVAGAGMGNAVQEVWQVVNRPFTTPLSSVDIFLLVGVILVAVVLWNLILFHIRIAAETI